MKKFKLFFTFLYRKRYLQFFLTGGSGVLLNIMITWSLTKFVFGVDRYMIGYLIGATVNVCYNFALHTLLTFQTKKHHGRRFAGFIVYSLMSATLQIAIVRMLTEYFGRAYYLIIIAGTIFILSVISFIFFKHALFNDGQDEFAAKDNSSLALMRLSLGRFFQSGWRRILLFLSSDMRVLSLIFLLAALTRFPFLSYPDRTLFDETIYLNYTIHTVEQIPFFDIHPPLARMIFAEIARETPFTLQGTEMALDQGFGDFPYIPLRRFIALCGILLPLVLYGIGRRLGYAPRAALFPALFVIFDNALTLASRAILPDMFLLLLSFLGLFAVLITTTTKKKAVRLISVLFAGLFLGAALSVKWTALGVIGLAFLWLVYKKFWKYALSILGVAVLVYVSVFYTYFTMFPRGGSLHPILPPYSLEWITDVAYPHGNEPLAILRFIPEFHQLIIRANNDTGISMQILQTPGPLSWPLAQSAMQFWKNGSGTRVITLMGNSVLWVAAFFMLLFELFWIALHHLRMRRYPIDESETFLLVGYLLNYLPFFFIARPMHLYHYFTALLFLFLLLPKVTPRIIHCVTLLSRDRMIGSVIITGICVGVIVNFFLLAPMTYGF